MLILVGLICFLSGAQAETVVITPGFAEKTLANTYSLPTPLKTRDLHFSYTLENKQNEFTQLYLSFINPLIDQIVVKITNDTGTVTYLLGDDLPFPKRIIKHYNLVLPLEIGPGKSVSLQILIKTQLEPLNFTINLAEQNTFIKRTNHDNLFMGAFYGIFFMFLLLLVCFYIFSRSKYFIIYFVINLMTILLFMLYIGTGYQYLWFYSPVVQRLMPVLLATGYLSAHVYFIRDFFNVEIRYIRFNTIINIYFYISVLIILFSLVQLMKTSHWNVVFSDYYWIICTLFIVYGFLVLGISLYTYRKTKKREAIWVFIGASVQFLNWIIFIENIYGSSPLIRSLVRFQLFPSHIFVPHISFVLVAIELFMISYFITVNYHTLIRQNDISGKRLAYLQQRNINTFILGQEETREKITQSIEQSILSDIKLSEAKTKTLLNLENGSRIDSILLDFAYTINDLKNITSNYVAPDMQNIDFRTLVQTALDKLYLEKEVNFDFTDIYSQFALNANANTHLYRVLQEVSNNIIKHAGAEKITFFAQLRNKLLLIRIKDDGIGMSSKKPFPAGIGLINIESRINSLNGSFKIESSPDKGTTYIFELPAKEII